MLPFGTRIKSTMGGQEGTIVGYGSLQWPADNRINGDDGIMHAVYLVQVMEGSSSLGQALIAFRADRVEEVA